MKEEYQEGANAPIDLGDSDKELLVMWISTLERCPSGTKRPGGISDDVLVSVECDNGIKFVAIDRYDPLSMSWEEHGGDIDGRHVTHWMPLPLCAT